MRCVLALTLLLLVSGCGGISGSHSVSPATFFLPGLGQVGSDSDLEPVVAEESDILVAQVN